MKRYLLKILIITFILVTILNSCSYSVTFVDDTGPSYSSNFEKVIIEINDFLLFRIHIIFAISVALIISIIYLLILRIRLKKQDRYGGNLNKKIARLRKIIYILILLILIFIYEASWFKYGRSGFGQNLSIFSLIFPSISIIILSIIMIISKKLCIFKEQNIKKMSKVILIIFVISILSIAVYFNIQAYSNNNRHYRYFEFGVFNSKFLKYESITGIKGNIVKSMIKEIIDSNLDEKNIRENKIVKVSFEDEEFTDNQISSLVNKIENKSMYSVEPKYNENIVNKIYIKKIH